MIKTFSISGSGAVGSDTREVRVARADELIDELVVDGRITAMKDPRTLFTGAVWRDRALIAGATIRYIGTFRRPERVVASLTARDPSMDAALCSQLWIDYNRRLIELYDESPFPIVDFDLEPDRYLAQVTSAFVELGLEPPPRLEFFDGSLRHQETLHEWDSTTASIYDELSARSIEL